MAIAHPLRGAGDFELDRAAKAFSCEAHGISLFDGDGPAGLRKAQGRGRDSGCGLQSSGQPCVLDSRDQSQAFSDGSCGRPLHRAGGADDGIVTAEGARFGPCPRAIL
jgi:hypothetical protein